MTSQKVHAANPNMKVIGMGTQGQNILNTIPQCPKADGVVYHPYGRGDKVPESTYERSYLVYEPWIDALRAKTSLPLRETERNCDNPATVNQTAVWNARRLTQSFAKNVEQTFIYTFQGRDAAQTVVSNDATPIKEPTYFVVQRILVAMAGFSGTTSIATLINSQTGFDSAHFMSHVFQNTASGSTICAVWFGNRPIYADGTAPAPQTCGVHFPSQHVHAFNKCYVLDTVTGAKTPIAESFVPNGPYWGQGGPYQIPVSERPLYIVLP
jgi:hypothetical protein